MTFQLLIFPDQTQLSLVKHEKGWIEFEINSYPQISYWVDLPKTFSMAPLEEMKPQNGLTRENVGDGAVTQYNNAMRQNMRLHRRLLSRISALPTCKAFKRKPNCHLKIVISIKISLGLKYQNI